MSYTRIALKKLSLGEFMRLPEPPKCAVFHKWFEGEDFIQLQSHAITIVQSRDVKRNVKIASRIVFDIAKEHAGKDVWYVNTYSAVKRVKEAFRAESLRLEAGAGESTPQPPPRAEAGELGAEVEELGAEVEESNIERGEYGDDGCQFGAKLDDPEYDLLPNIFVSHVASGQWRTEELIRDIMERSRGEKGEVPEGLTELEERNDVVVIVNSFEYATLTYHQKRKMVFDLMIMQERMGCTLVLFSSEMRQDIIAGMPGRGPMGLLAGKAEVVANILDPFEKLIRKREPAKQRGSGTVHEAQTKQASLPKPKKPKVKIEPDYFFSEYAANPWLDKTERCGAYLASLAIDLDLKLYYHNHPDDVFVRGQEPRSIEIKRGTYVQPQPVRKWVEED